jgi:ABC-2 type transport system ATP-binding protein
MILNPDIDSRIEEIRNLVAANELNTATRRAMDLANDFAQRRATKNRSIDIRGAFSEIRETDWGDFTAARSAHGRLRQQILDFADQIADEFSDSTQNRLASKQHYDRPQPVRTSHAPGSIDTYEPQTELEKAKQRHIDKKRTHELKSTSPSDPLVKARSVTKTFRRNSRVFTLAPFDLELRLGQITAVVGENGNGKSTILRIVAGVLAPDAGQLTYPFLSGSGATDMVGIKARLAYIPQEIPPWHGQLFHNLHLAASLHGIVGQQNDDEVDFYLHRLGLDRFKNATWEEISGGFRTRFELAKMMIWHPDLLVLDEPLANLDVTTQLLFLQDLRFLVDSLRHPMSALVSSQHLHEVEAIADNIIFVQEGTVRYNGAVVDFGADREANSFELHCGLSKDQLLDALEGVQVKGFENAGFNFIVHTTKTVTMSHMMTLLGKEEIPLDYLRDISKSTRKLFHSAV